MEGQPITGIKTMTGRVFHLPNTIWKEVPSFWSKCNTNLEGRIIAQRFDTLTDPNICKHCAMKAWQEYA